VWLRSVVWPLSAATRASQARGFGYPLYLIEHCQDHVMPHLRDMMKEEAGK